VEVNLRFTAKKKFGLSVGYPTQRRADIQIDAAHRRISFHSARKALDSRGPAEG
jgi:hypothetical protein